jgi:hypothetical protein
LSSVLKTIDRLNFAVVKLTALHQNRILGHATGFFFFGLFGGRPNHWLVTNWHVVSGRNAEDPERILNASRLQPTHLRLQLVIKDDDPEYAKRPEAKILLHEQILGLYDQDGRALWYQHQLKNEVDIAVMNTGGLFGRHEIVGINELPHRDIAVEIGNEVFILGYPLGFTHFVETPIWKRGSIASEPNLETPESKGRVVIDATTRSGMSGAPVVMRCKTHYLSEKGEIVQHPNAFRWIGVYASRPALDLPDGALPEDRTAELGYIYKMSRVSEIVMNGVRGPDGGCWP